jgi:hypothetical protein
MMPTVVLHADWGTHPDKRWKAKAVLLNEQYTAYPPVLVGHHHDFLQDAKSEIGNEGIALIGFDFPIGIPLSFAELIGVQEFKPFLMSLGEGRWSDFFDVCKHASEISPSRPFYPHKPGGTKHSHLVSGLGVAEIDDLRRGCELRHDGRNAACPLFWTLGANQVGKAAICGWRDVLIPALRGSDPPLLWPFDGSLDYLLRPGNLVIAETYPAEYYGWLFKTPLKGKGQLAVRQSAARELLGWADGARVQLAPDLEQMIIDGFPNDDAFDAVVGLFGMLQVALGRPLSGVIQEKAITALEGWILGQTA